jgi:hypothetical protein
MLQSAVQRERTERESLSESSFSLVLARESERLFLPAMITAADLHYSPGPLQSASLSPAERPSSQLLSLSNTSVTLFVVAVVKLIQRPKKLTSLVWPTLKATLTIRSKDKIMIALLECMPCLI